MRAREFIRESRTGSLEQDVANALPATYVLPELQNQDPYKQYRFGVAIASAKGKSARKNDNIPPFEKSSAWGENMVVVSYDPNIEEWLDDALEEVGLSPSDKRMISTRKSEEAADVPKGSPVAKRKPNKYGV